MANALHPLVVVTAPEASHPDARDVEIVERKGRGHPDSICDALAEALSIALTRTYQERAGTILHHNVDKVLLAAGSTRPAFGGGEVLARMQVFLAGRATQTFDGHVIPVDEIARQTSRALLGATLHALDVDRHVTIHSHIRPGSSALTQLMPQDTARAWVANDTSFAVGYAPPSRLERIVLAVERTLTSPPTLASYPFIGEDVKVMGVRRGHDIDLTIAAAIVDRHVRNQAEYDEAIASIARLAEHAACEIHHHHIRIRVNAADDRAAGRLYLTVVGSSAEAGDDGETGRGNRIGGLIAAGRPMTLEAAAGKNVVAHVGKSYGIAAHRMARAVVEQCPEVADAVCLLVSRIGWPVDMPQVINVQVRTRDDLPIEPLQEPVERIVRACLDELRHLPQRLLTHARIESPADWPGIPLF